MIVLNGGRPDTAWREDLDLFYPVYINQPISPVLVLDEDLTHLGETEEIEKQDGYRNEPSKLRFRGEDTKLFFVRTVNRSISM